MWLWKICACKRIPWTSRGGMVCNCNLLFMTKWNEERLCAAPDLGFISSNLFNWMLCIMQCWSQLKCYSLLLVNWLRALQVFGGYVDFLETSVKNIFQTFLDWTWISITYSVLCQLSLEFWILKLCNVICDFLSNGCYFLQKLFPTINLPVECWLLCAKRPCWDSPIPYSVLICFLRYVSLFISIPCSWSMYGSPIDW